MYRQVCVRLRGWTGHNHNLSVPSHPIPRAFAFLVPRIRAVSWAWVGLGVVVLPGGCTGPGPPWTQDVTFDTARVWIHGETDSTALVVEVARTEAQQARGLSSRAELDPGSGMLFVFDEVRPDTAGFWMWSTRMPLDIAFLDREGEILEVLAMEPCESRDRDACPVYAPGVSYWFALEVNRGWFDRHDIGIGDRVDTGGVSPTTGDRE